MMTKEQKSRIWELAQSKGMSLEDLKLYTMKEVDTPLSNLTNTQADEVLNKLNEICEPDNVVEIDLTNEVQEVI